MPKDNEKIPLFDDAVPLASEPRGFSFAEMVRCEECLRANPPTRLNCMYCSAALPASKVIAAPVRPATRKLEKWEPGYHNILVGSPSELSDEVMGQLTSFLHLEAADAKLLLAGRRPLPIALSATREEAELIERRVKDVGLQTMIVSDAELKFEVLPRRVRALRFAEPDLLVYHLPGADGTRLAWNDIALVITARLRVKQVEIKELKTRKAENEIIDTREASSDEPVVDIFARVDDCGWRIAANSFDFSCLGDEKGLIAAENFSKLLAVMGQRAPQAEFDDSYDEARRALIAVWPLEQQTLSQGLRRNWKGKYGTAELMTTSNESQFTRYARLSYYFKRRLDWQQ